MIPYPSDLTAAQWALIEPLLSGGENTWTKEEGRSAVHYERDFLCAQGWHHLAHVAARFRSMEDRVPLLSPLAPHRTVGPNPRSTSG